MVMCPGMSVYICVCVLTNEGEMEFRETNARHRMEFLKFFWYPDYIASHLGQVRIWFILISVPFHLAAKFYQNRAVLIYIPIIWNGMV